MNDYKEKIEKHVLPVIAFEESIIESANGVYVTDVEGNKILDMSAGQFCTILGHSNENFRELFERIMKIQHTNTATLTRSTVEVYEKINALIPELESKIITLSTGAEAIEFAMRYAKNFTNKTGVISFDRGYHGLSLGAQTVTYGGKFAKPYIEQVYSIPTYEEWMTEEDEDCIINQLENICTNDNNIAAIFIEPIVGVGGIHKLSRRVAKKIRDICDTYEIFLIFDECQSGFGRGGAWFYYQVLGVNPDILVTAKGIGLGFPVSLVAVRGDKVEEDKVIVHYSSHQNDPFSGEIINFAIDYMKEHNLIEKCIEKGKVLKDKIDNLHCKNFTPVRGDGLLLGFDLEIEGVDDYRQISAKFRKHVRENGCLVQSTNGGKTIRLLPSYEITDQEIDHFISILRNSIDSFDFGD